MISATRVLRLAFGRTSDPPEPSPQPPLVEVVGFCRDFLFSGSVALEADRLTDLLNGCDEIELVDVVVQWLDDGQQLERPRVTLRRQDLLAVKAGGPRGNSARRRPTRQTAVAGAAGPYTFGGYVHTRRGGDPGIDIGRRDPMIPLTDASIRFALGSASVVDEAATLIINRDAAASLRPTTHADRIGAA